TLLTVLPDDGGGIGKEHADRFLAAGQRTLTLLGVGSATRVRFGDAAEEIRREIASGDHDLIVMGAPLGSPDRRAGLEGLVARLVNEGLDRPLLITRSHQAADRRSDRP